MTTDMVRAYINITPEDKATLEREYGYGWSTNIRDLIHEHCRKIRDKQTERDFDDEQ